MVPDDHYIPVKTHIMIYPEPGILAKHYRLQWSDIGDDIHVAALEFGYRVSTEREYHLVNRWLPFVVIRIGFKFNHGFWNMPYVAVRTVAYRLRPEFPAKYVLWFEVLQ